jgi:hypothetical protein
MNNASFNVPQKVKYLAVIPYLLLFFSVLLSLVKLWLVSGQEFYAATSLDDDLMFLANAKFLLKAEWLGPYSQWTMTKGPFYPLWIAVTTVSGIPLFFTQHLLYIIACSIFLLSIRFTVQKPVMLFLIFVILLFNPMSFSDPIGTRAAREGIYPALTILILSGAIGMMIRYDRPLKILSLWSLGLGIALSAFWLTREEGIWMLMPILTIVGITALRVYRAKLGDSVLRLIFCILPFVILLVSLFTVATINKTYYGIFSTVEFKWPPLLDAYGSLTRVKHANWNPKIPVPRKTREKIYEVAPSFAELEEYLDGPQSKIWINDSCYNLSICDDIAGGWFVWAFRYAVADKGYYHSGETTMTFYKRLASEINTACDEKRLDCGPARSTLISPWHAEYAWPLLTTIVDAAVYLAEFRESRAEGLDVERFIFRQRSHLSKTDDLKIPVLNRIGSGYQSVTSILVILALTAFIIVTIYIFRKRILTDLYVINSAIIMAIAGRLLILSLIDVSSFPAVNIIYLSPAYPLLLIFIILSLTDGMKLVFHKPD